ncbi:MAG: glutamine amidotransferase, partial [Oscillospiraceae bacterium]|nr:glutamine amidotransferase [Oscillospiraceae bacterium]
RNDSVVGPGEYLAWARRRGHTVTEICCREEGGCPSPASLPDMLIVLGGPQCPATTRAECPFFDAEAEKALIRRCAEAGRAVVGVCLGAQLVGEALGAPYEHSPERETGPVTLTLTPEGKRDPLLRGFPDAFPAGQWHGDMPGLTDGCAVLAFSEGCPRQIVRYAPLVYALQCHMEFTHDIIVSLLQNRTEPLPEGRFVQSETELLTYDYTEMNARLSAFLDALEAAYER